MCFKFNGMQVTLKDVITDIHGQNLFEDTIVEFPVEAPTTPFLDIAKSMSFGDFSISSSIITLDPALPPVLHITSRNVRELEVRAYSVSAVQNFNRFSFFLEQKNAIQPSLHEVWRNMIEVQPPLLEDDENYKGKGGKAWFKDARSTLDLSKAFGCDDSKECGKNKESHLVLVVHAAETVALSADPLCKKYWLSWTDVGLSYFADEDAIYG